MMSEQVVRGASIWRDDGWQTVDLAARDGCVVDAVGPDADVIDGTGLLAAPGFIDLQCNGALGIDLAREPERIWELAAGLPRWGVTAWLPTIVTAPDGIIARALAALTAGPPPGWTGAFPLGLHLEGPFLAPAKKGAHARAWLRPPSLAAIEGWSRQAGVRLVTLAPEMEGAAEVIDALIARGVVVSLGHSAATAAQTSVAIDAGATYVTHLFNAMNPLHHREPGLAGIALADPRVHVGLIVDGVHVHPEVVALSQRALADRLTLVTDAAAPLGMPGEQHTMGSVTVRVGDDGVRLEDGTLAGSHLSMDQAVRNLVRFSGCAPEVALLAASAAPAVVIGERERGALTAGARADIVLLDQSLHLVSTIVGGHVLHA